MNFWTRPTGLFLLLIMVLMAFQAGLKKPVCIDSPVVYKFDIINAPNVSTAQTVYSCQQLKLGSLATPVQETIDIVNGRLNKLQMLLNRIQVTGAVHLTLDLNTDQQISSEKIGQLLIGVSALSQPGLETEILKQVLMQRRLKGNNEAAEALADFLTNRVEGPSQWSHILYQTYNQLSAIEQLAFKQFVMNRLKNGDFSESLTTEKFFENFFTAPNQQQAGRFLFAMNGSQKFQLLFYQQLQKIGLKPSEQVFDVVIQVRDVGSVDIAELKALAETFPQTRVAFQDRTGLYVLPYMIKASPEQTRLLKTQWTLLLGHEEISVPLFAERAEKTDKLVLMNYHRLEHKLDFKPLFKSGVPAFLGANKKVEFVQFHMSSFSFRLAHLRSVHNYFKWLKEDRFTEDKQKALGWQSQFWSLERQAYKPVAVYDVIQYYRIN